VSIAIIVWHFADFYWNLKAVSRLEPTTSMVLRSQTRGGRSSAAIPDVEVRPEIETRQKPEMDNPAEIEFSVSTTCEGDLGATEPITAENPSEIAETESKYVTRDRPEAGISSSLFACQEVHQKSTFSHHRRRQTYFSQLYRPIVQKSAARKEFNGAKSTKGWGHIMAFCKTKK